MTALRHKGVPAKLEPFSSNKLSIPVSGSHFACNPVISLTATIGDSNTVLCVWRTGEQLVSKHSERNHKALALKWKQDGQFLASGWSDGVVRLAGLESSKALHHIKVCEPGGAEIDFVAWSSNLTGKVAAARKRPGTVSSHDISLDDDKSLSDLPHELTFLEVETALPKLSPLPVSGGSGNDMFIFSTTSSLEFVFRPLKAEEASIVPVMIVGTSDGRIHLSIYDSFVIGSFGYSPRTQLPSPSKFHLCGHASHPELSTHALLFKPQGPDTTSLHLVPIDLIFVHKSPVNLSLLASKMTSIQNLLRYLKQTQAHMLGEWKSTRERPERFLNAIREDLEKLETGPISIVQALYHTAVTGHVLPPVKEWLVDSIGAEKHKLWDKVVVSGLLHLRGLVHENFLPALERCGINLSRLLGIARYHDGQESIGFTAAQITRLLDIVSCLTVVGRRVLTSVMDELEHFQAFSSWLRLEIDKQATSRPSDELTEKEATMDTVKVLTYIKRYLLGSPLELHFAQISRPDLDESLKLAEDGFPLLEMLDKPQPRQGTSQRYPKALPKVEFLVDLLTNQANVVFHDIAEAEKRSVRFGSSTELSIGDKIWKHDVQMCSASKTDTPEAIIFTAVVPENNKEQVTLFRTKTPVVNGISGASHTQVSDIFLPSNMTVIDLKFLDDEGLFVLCSSKKGETVLLRILYQSPLVMYTEGRPPMPVGVNDELLQSCLRWRFSQLPSGFTPVQMDVLRASKARGEIPARVCLLGRDRTTLLCYALPEEWEAAMVKMTLEEGAEK